jgi:hypothetical protein
MCNLSANTESDRHCHRHVALLYCRDECNLWEMQTVSLKLNVWARLTPPSTNLLLDADNGTLSPFWYVPKIRGQPPQKAKVTRVISFSVPCWNYFDHRRVP